mmetsp:Transcript_41888/g.103802  ORF Transcript_41888/g.103802 Transcript_41888/m.103802 type:complete len:217 (-) Transcript_41888:302-952(-)
MRCLALRCGVRAGRRRLEQITSGGLLSCCCCVCCCCCVSVCVRCCVCCYYGCCGCGCCGRGGIGRRGTSSGQCAAVARLRTRAEDGREGGRAARTHGANGLRGNGGLRRGRGRLAHWEGGERGGGRGGRQGLACRRQRRLARLQTRLAKRCGLAAVVRCWLRCRLGSFRGRARSRAARPGRRNALHESAIPAPCRRRRAEPQPLVVHREHALHLRA